MIGNYFGPNAFAGIGGFIGPILVIFGAVVPWEAAISLTGQEVTIWHF